MVFTPWLTYYTYTYIHIYTHTYTHIRVHTHTYTYMHIETHIYTYIHIQTWDGGLYYLHFLVYMGW